MFIEVATKLSVLVLCVIRHERHTVCAVCLEYLLNRAEPVLTSLDQLRESYAQFQSSPDTSKLLLSARAASIQQANQFCTCVHVHAILTGCTGISSVIRHVCEFSHRLGDTIVQGYATSHSTTKLDEIEGECVARHVTLLASSRFAASTSRSAAGFGF